MKVTVTHLRRGLEARLRLARRWREQRHVPTIDDGLDTVVSTWNLPPADDAPVFLLACGWRSGSTYLQRLVIGAGRDLIWGEPYATTDLLGRLTMGFSAFAHGPQTRHLISQQEDTSPAALSASWIANLYPDPIDFVESQRDLFRRLYGQPAADRGYDNWGIKEVRYGFPEARYLHVLFPRARFVFLHRNPYDAWNSYQSGYRGSSGRPGEYVWTSRQYGRMWHALVAGVINGADSVNGLVVGYDDLASGAAAPALNAHLGLDLPFERLAEPVGSTSWGRSRTGALVHRRLAAHVEPLAGSLGYR